MPKFKIGNFKKYILPIILAFIGNAIFGLTVWLLLQYENIIFDQFLYQIITSTKGSDATITLSGFFTIGGFAFGLTAIEGFIFATLSGKCRWFKNKDNYEKFSASLFAKFFSKTLLPLSLAVLIFGTSFFAVKLELPRNIKMATTKSDFIEKNYVDPKEVNIEFPEKKRNLIYIFLESMENSYVENNKNYIPELKNLATENVSFSNTEGIGGAYSFHGTTWTASAMVAQTSGLTVKIPYITRGYNKKGYMSGCVTLGDILEKEGYNQVILMGSDAGFANKDIYFTQHGKYKLVDTNSVKADGRLPKHYRKWWGFEDEKLFAFAKEELLKLSKSEEPFNLTLLTADTHFPNGYKCELCQNDYDSGYANSLACSSKQVYEFVEWIKQQPFYENTTIVLCGDHLTMDPLFMSSVDEDYCRTLYNCFINTAAEPLNLKNREYATFDMLPTTLAAMGVKIEDDRLALGTNLFSDRKTLTEEFGFERLDEELQKKSEFYNKEILR